MIKNFIYFLTPSIFQMIISILVIVPITTYYLDPYDFGIIALLFAVTLPLNSITSAPDWVLGGNYHQSNERNQKIILFNILIIDFLLRTSLVILFYYLGNSIIIYFQVSTYENINLLYNLVLFGTWLALFWTTVSKLLIITGKGKHHLIWDISKFILGASVTITLISYYELGTISIIYGFVATNLYSIVFELIYIRKYVILYFDIKWFKKILSFVYLSLPLNLSSALQPLIERVSIQTYLGLSNLGVYTHAQIYSNAFKFINKSAAHAVTKSSILSYNSNDADSIFKIEKLLKVLFLLLNFAGFLIILFIGDIINILTHGKFNQSAELVPFLYMIIFSSFYGIMPTQCLIANSKKNILFLSEFIFTLVCIIMILLLIDSLGLKGVIFAVLFSNMSLQIWRRIASARLGFTSNIDNYFWITILSYLIFYFLINYLNLDLLYRFYISSVIFVMMFLVFFKNFYFIVNQIKYKNNESNEENTI